MAGTQKIELIDAIAIARGTTEPSNRDVLWIDETITGNIYEKIKWYNEGSGSWELVQRTAAQLLLDLKTVDGQGSGLDADTLDGYTAAELLQGEIKLSSGEILVGQLNDQAAAKTLSGIATIDINGALSYVANSISHTGLTDIGTNTHAQIDTHIADATIHFTEASIDHANILNIGTNTHAQIDTHIADATIHFTEASIDHTAIQNIGVNTHAQIDSHISSTANPHGVTAAQVGNTTAQWNANSIEGNLTNVGVLGVGQDGQALVWDNATSRFITATVSSPSLYTGSGTVPSSVVATLTDTLTFDGGTVNIQGADTVGTNSALEIFDGDTVPSSLWDFRNNGDVYLGKDSNLDLGTNILTFDNGRLISKVDQSTTNENIIDSYGLSIKNNNGGLDSLSGIVWEKDGVNQQARMFVRYGANNSWNLDIRDSGFKNALKYESQVLTVFNETTASTSGQDVLQLRANHSSGTVGSGGKIGFMETSAPTNYAAFIQSYTFGAGNTGLGFATGFGSSPSNRLLIDGNGEITIGVQSADKIGFFNTSPIVQVTTGVTAATFTANTSGIADDTATFDGYTIGQVVKALRNYGLLA